MMPAPAELIFLFDVDNTLLDKMFGPGESWRYFDPRGGGSAMAGSLHGNARTTPRVRAELQASQERKTSPRRADGTA